MKPLGSTKSIGKALHERRKGVDEYETITDLEVTIEANRPNFPTWETVYQRLRKDTAEATRRGYKNFRIVVEGVK